MGLKGKKLTEEHKRKIGEANKGKCYSPLTTFKHGHTTNIGRSCSDDAKARISLANKGKSPSLKNRMATSARVGGKYGKDSMRYGKKCTYTLEQRIKMSEKARKGTDHYLWKGGVSDENTKARRSLDNRLWREAVFRRDNWTCLVCRSVGNQLRCHHVENFSSNQSKRFLIENGVTFCRKCHDEFHVIYGKTKNNRRQITDFIKNKQHNMYLTEDQKQKIKSEMNPAGSNPKDVNWMKLLSKDGEYARVEVGYWSTKIGCRPRYQKEILTFKFPNDEE